MEQTASLSPHLPERSELLNTIDVKSMNFTELSAALSEMGLPSYRAKQIYSWIHQKCALDYDEMTNLPLSLREKLKEELPLKSALSNANRYPQRTERLNTFRFRRQ